MNIRIGIIMALKQAIICCERSNLMHCLAARGVYGKINFAMTWLVEHTISANKRFFEQHSMQKGLFGEIIHVAPPH